MLPQHSAANERQHSAQAANRLREEDAENTLTRRRSLASKAGSEDYAFKKSVIQDILNQIDYQAALNRGVVDVDTREISTELQQLSTRSLLAWYEAFLFIRSELMFAGYELNGFRVLDRPVDAIRKLMESDPNFDIRQYIF
ncbi:hypothetical protein EDS67_07215 [candidate division KSB1 bacterium]|nr:MAG: hypothetical protein EDS67_07215 [candidate division KSB1 bacterium]MBC6947582.1 hypothetical protein [candidate division KSB1 bacterium]MCE7941378.1 hypothetical protein [Chlorobi bacterium CHB1]MDL1877612.1 hypothetical protein [Cytophagia bacterium CHB2]